MLIKAILVGLVLGLCKSEWIYGFPQVGRPIVVSTLTGLFLGDPVQGVIMGSVLELMFIGSFPIGAAVSPDYTSAGAIWRWKGSSNCNGIANCIVRWIHFHWM